MAVIEVIIKAQTSCSCAYLLADPHSDFVSLGGTLLLLGRPDDMIRKQKMGANVAIVGRFTNSTAKAAAGVVLAEI